MKSTYEYPTISRAFNQLDVEISGHGRRYVADRWDLQRIEDALADLNEKDLTALCSGNLSAMQRVSHRTEALTYADELLATYCEIGEPKGASNG